MMMNISDPGAQQILSGRRVATLATQNADGSMQLTAVWYLAEGDSIYIGTSSASRKGRNLAERPNASFMVDVREPGHERGVSVSASAEIIRGAEAKTLNLRIQRRYLSPAAIQDVRLGPKLLEMDDITIKLKPAYVFSWDMEAMDAAVFGGAFSKPGYVLPLEP